MDVHCCSCGEPWDSNYLMHELPYELGTEDWVKTFWYTDGEFKGLSNLTRQAAKEQGWKFGSSIFSILECACCPENPILNKEKSKKAEAVAELFPNDLDAQLSFMEDFGL